MGEAKRRQKLDPTFGKVPRTKTLVRYPLTTAGFDRPRSAEAPDSFDTLMPHYEQGVDPVNSYMVRGGLICELDMNLASSAFMFIPCTIEQSKLVIDQISTEFLATLEPMPDMAFCSETNGEPITLWGITDLLGACAASAIFREIYDCIDVS